METKFIEGTNQQYSIRKDGVVIKHYSNTKHNTKSYNEKELSIHNGLSFIYINKKKTTVSIQYLLFDYFNCKLCRCNSFIYNREQNVCNNCQKKVQSKFDVIKKENITKSYAASMLHISVNDLSDEMYNLYKANLKVKRLLSEKTGIPTNLIK